MRGTNNIYKKTAKGKTKNPWISEKGLVCTDLAQMWVYLFKWKSQPNSELFPWKSDCSAALVFSGCCNKLLQIEWLSTTEIYSFMVLEARSPKSSCLDWLVPSGGSERGSFHASLLGSGGRWKILTFFGLQWSNSSFFLFF